MELIRPQEESNIGWIDVKQVIYNVHKTKGSPDMIKVSYICGLRMFNEFICFDHTGYAKKKAAEWWLKMAPGIPPTSTADALRRIGQLARPKQIKIWVSRKYPEVMAYRF